MVTGLRPRLADLVGVPTPTISEVERGQLLAAAGRAVAAGAAQLEAQRRAESYRQLEAQRLAWAREARAEARHDGSWLRGKTRL